MDEIQLELFADAPVAPTYLFFDTETTGLPKSWKAPVTDLDNWPRLVQLAYVAFDAEGGAQLKKRSENCEKKRAV